MIINKQSSTNRFPSHYITQNEKKVKKNYEKNSDIIICGAYIVQYEYHQYTMNERCVYEDMISSRPIYVFHNTGVCAARSLCRQSETDREGKKRSHALN